MPRNDLIRWLNVTHVVNVYMYIYERRPVASINEALCYAAASASLISPPVFSPSLHFLNISRTRSAVGRTLREGGVHCCTCLFSKILLSPHPSKITSDVAQRALWIVLFVSTYSIIHSVNVSEHKEHLKSVFYQVTWTDGNGTEANDPLITVTSASLYLNTDRSACLQCLNGCFALERPVVQWPRRLNTAQHSPKRAVVHV